MTKYMCTFHKHWCKLRAPGSTSHHECPFTTTSVTALHCALLASSFSMTTCDAARWQRWAVCVMSMMPCFRNAVDDGPEDLVWTRLHIMSQLPCFRNAVDDGPEDLVWARLHFMDQQFGWFTPISIRSSLCSACLTYGSSLTLLPWRMDVQESAYHEVPELSKLLADNDLKLVICL